MCVVPVVDVGGQGSKEERVRERCWVGAPRPPASRARQRPADRRVRLLPAWWFHPVHSNLPRAPTHLTHLPPTPTHSDTQAIAEVNRKLQEGSFRRVVGKQVVTELAPAGDYYLAEQYHQQYLSKGGRMGTGQSAAKGCKDQIRCYG